MERVIAAYQRRVAAMVISIVGRDEDWQDLCQQIFVKMVLGLPRLARAELFEPWLLRIARNCCFDHLRRRRARRIFVPWSKAHDAIAADCAADAGERIAAMRAAIDRLSSDQRKLMQLAGMAGWSYSRIAEATGHSLAAIKSSLFRARRRVRRLMSEE